MLPTKRRFIKRTIKCPHPGCDKLVVNAGGLTQHMQASHSAAKRHAQQLPSPGPMDHEQTSFGDDMEEVEGARQQRGAFTIFHPLIDGLPF